MLTEKQSILMSNRNVDISQDGELDFYNLLNIYTDLNKVASLIKKHMTNNNFIVSVVDKDADGLNAGAVLYKGFLNQLNYKNHLVIISKRIDGNGVNDTVVKQLKELHKTKPISLIMTADMGSSDNKNLTLLKNELDVDTIITDHHTIPQNDYPSTVDAFINPERTDNKEHLPISGCFMAFLTIVATRLLIDKNTDKEFFNDLLPHVAITTLTDVISLKYKVNRDIVKVGLNEMNSLRDPLWKIMKISLGILTTFNDITIGFNIGPIFNTGNRTNNEEIVLELLTTSDTDVMRECMDKLIVLSNTRKRAQKGLYKEALVQVALDERRANTPIIKTNLAINGIIAGKLAEFNNKPSVCFVDNGTDILSGSARGIAGDMNIVEVFKRVDEADNHIIIKYGGHKHAAGITIHKDKIEDFRNLIDKFISEYPKPIQPIPKVDLVIKPSEILPSLVDELEVIKPAGKDFNPVILKTKLKLKAVYDYKVLFKFIFLDGNRELIGTYFKNNYATFDHDNVRGYFNSVRDVEVIYTLELNSFNRVINLNLNILDVKRI